MHHHAQLGIKAIIQAIKRRNGGHNPKLAGNRIAQLGIAASVLSKIRNNAVHNPKLNPKSYADCETATARDLGGDFAWRGVAVVSGPHVLGTAIGSVKALTW